MKSHISRLSVVVAAVLFAVLGLSVGLSVRATGVQNRLAQQEPPVSDTALPQAQPPVLRIGGKVDPNVYLQSLDVQTEVTGNIASTRYTMVFKNKTNRILEGELTFPLPDGRTVTHYALDINGRMRDAVPVEKARATQVFEEIQQREVDPGLLERVEGNNYRTRIYPIPANGARTVSIGYEEELSLENGRLYYRLPMAYVNPVEKFSVKATVWKSELKPIVPEDGDMIRFDRAGENYEATLVRENYRPTRALIFALPAPVDIPRVMTQSAQGSFYFLASVAPNVSTRKKRWSDDLAIIWDVSLSGSQRDLAREMEALDIIFTDKRNASVHLYYLNNRLAKTGQYRVNNGNWSALKRVLQSAVFDGGTDFSQIDLSKIAGNEILLFSDGLSTLSYADFVGDVNPNRPVHCVVSSSKADYSAMRLISGKTRGKFVNISALSAARLRTELLNETLQFLGVERGNGVSEVYPSVATPVYGNFSIAGISSRSNAELTLLFGFGNTVEKRIKVNVDTRNASRQGNVYRIWAQKKIAELDLNFERNRGELTELGNQFGIVTRNTSLIVLEEIGDYVRFNIEPPASEPELLAEYQRRRKGLDDIRRDAERDMLNEAVATVQRLANWWISNDRRLEAQDGDPPSWLRGGMTKTTLNERSRGSQTQRPVFEERGSQSNMSAYEERNERKSMKSAPSQSVRAQQGGGDPRARVTQERVLGIVSGEVKGKTVASADVFGRGGFATDIDAILSGVDVLKQGGDGGVGRKGVAGIGYGAGYGSGFGGGGDDVRGSQTARPETGVLPPDVPDGDSFAKQRSELKVWSPDFMKSGQLTGGRSRASIQRVVMQNMAALRHAYNRRLREKPGMFGRITVKFAINESGNVTFAQMEESTMNDPELERTIVARVKSWNFERIDKPGDITEVKYPFVFSNGFPSGGDDRPADTMSARVRDSINHELARVRDSVHRVRDSIYREQARVRDSLARVIAEKHYMRGLTGALADDYRKYLRVRDGFADFPTFYFDMADWFYRHGDREIALRILTSIADLELENASLYRLLGYRFKEYGEYALQKFVCQKVIQWRPMEPQSYRDYALALADNGEDQAALDSLNSLLTKSYSANIGRRSRGIEETVIAEINRLILKNPKLNASRIDGRLKMEMPVDVRVVINWNMNNVDIDLHVVDPNGETCYYQNPSTRIGGRMSYDNTSGYGPEQFMLRRAIRGKYGIYVNRYGAREFASDGPSTVMAEIYTRYAGKGEQRRIVTLQLMGARVRGDKVDVAEFEF